MARGVPRKYRHDWAYHGHWGETKVAPGRWKGRFRATKSGKTGVYDTDFRFTKRLLKARIKSGKHGPRPGSRLRWKLSGVQTAVKRIARRR